MRLVLSTIGIFGGLATMLAAQSTQSMRANIRGGGGDNGKCTIEVEVDGVADVEIRGDSGFIRTLEGQTSTWRRFECTSALPRNPSDFRFKGIDGRGNVQLVRQPSGAGGVAVVRIEDRQGGREGYTFDLEWRGGSYSNEPYNRNRRNDQFGDDQRDDRFGRNQRNDSYSNGNNRNRGIGGSSDLNQAAGVCQDAVRLRARRDYGVRNPYFAASNVNDNPGNRDRVVGSFEGNRGEYYEYSCTVNLNNGNVRDVNIRRR